MYALIAVFCAVDLQNGFFGEKPCRCPAGRPKTESRRFPGRKAAALIRGGDNKLSFRLPFKRKLHESLARMLMYNYYLLR